MKMTRTLATLSLSLIVLSAVSLRAQPTAPTAVQQLQNFQQNMDQQKPMVDLRAGGNAPETYTNENSDIGAQHILRVIPKPTMWQAVVDSQYFFTDNATLSQKTPANPLTSASVFVNTVSFAFAPTPYKVGDGRFAPTAGASVQWWNYEGATIPGGAPVSSIDFNAQTLFLGANYFMPNNWSFFANFDYTRIVQQPVYSAEFYHEFVPSAGVQRLFQVTQNSLFSASLQTKYHFGWVNNPPSGSQDRWDGILSLAYSWQPVPKVLLQPSYRLTETYYRLDTAGSSSGRNDVINDFRMQASYYFIPELSLQAFVSYDINSSDDNSVPGFNPGYKVFDVGLDLTFTKRF